MPRMETSDGVPLYYEIFGAAGDPILFIHPPLMGHVVFKHQRVLQTDYRVILYDLRGHGRSRGRGGEDALARHVDDLRELLDHLGLQSAHIVGYSAGGVIALDFALRYPEHVRTLILSGGFPKVSTWLLRRLFHAGIWLMKAGKTDFLARLLAFTHKTNEKDEQELRAYGKKADAAAVDRLYQDCLHYDCTAELQRLEHIPCLVLYGTRDGYIHAHHKWFRGLANVRIVFIDKGTHQLPTRFHEPFNHAVRRFLSDFKASHLHEP